MEEGVRVRLRFEDGDLLSESQKLEGLNRCWLFLSPQLKNVSDIASHLVNKFSLQDTCSNGLLLYMDGFVLPSFESTCIFKDKDIVRIKRKDGALISDGANVGANHIEVSQIVEKQPLLTGVKLLAIEGSGKDIQTEHEEPQEDALHLDNSSCGNMRSKKKRKYPEDDGPKGLINYCLTLARTSKRRKKAGSAITEEHQMIGDGGIEKDVLTRQKGNVHRNRCLSQKRLKKKGKSSNINDHSNVIVPTKVNDEVEDTDSVPNDERSDQVQVTGQKNADTSHMLNGIKKFPSRSARRKKAKRKWLRELASSQKKEITQNNQMLDNDMPKTSAEHQPPDDVEDEIVAVEIRPGHIRFEPLGKERSNEELKDRVETFQWSGTTSKRKGQKWGIEKTSVCRKNSDGDSREISIEKINVKDSKLVDGPLDIEKLVPLSVKPKDGDVIAYRLVELSSSWCPEISSFRVGKISSYDPLSGKVMLLPVPEYPVLHEKKDEPVDLLSSDSLYNEDSTLEIDFTSLIDVRIVNHEKSDPMTVNGSHEGPTCSQEAGVDKGVNHNTEVTPPVTENGGRETTVWDDIARTLSEKKSQLQQNNSFGAKESSAKGAWSHRALRSSALGPTMALLRSQNDVRG